MNNLEVIKRFLEGNKGQTSLRDIPSGYYMYKGRTLTTDGQSLINYDTEIAYKKDGKLYLNKTKYSVTTSKIQSQLSYQAKQYYSDDEIIEYKG
jgi:hypothetical protein